MHHFARASGKNLRFCPELKQKTTQQGWASLSRHLSLQPTPLWKRYKAENSSGTPAFALLDTPKFERDPRRFLAERIIWGLKGLEVSETYSVWKWRVETFRRFTDYLTKPRKVC